MAADSRSRSSAPRDDAGVGSAAARSGRFATLRRVPWWAVILSLLVMVSADFMVDPVRNASTFMPVTEVHLVVSSGYLLLAPICNVLDTLTLMSLRQHVAILVTLIVLYAAWRGWRGRRRGTGMWREVRAAVIALLSLLAVYAAGALIPRPMASLAVQPPFNDVLVVADFHSHTSYSHDGAPWFRPEANRRWHHAAGYDVAYITDHRTVRGAEEGIANNPPLAGQGTMILQGLEVVWDGAHVNILGAQRMYKGLTDTALRDVDSTALALASMVPDHEPIVVYTFPNLMRHLHAANGAGTAGARAIELVDGSPKGLGDSRRKRPLITSDADTLNMAMVAGTDNHGWGFTAPGWTLLQIPGWRGMSTDSLSWAIEQSIRHSGFDATEVVERREANTSLTNWRLAATVPLVVARMFTMISDNERVSWLIWIWAVVFAQIAWRRRKRGTAAAAA